MSPSTTTTRFRMGSRPSPMAMEQTGRVETAFRPLHPHIDLRITSQGDQHRGPLADRRQGGVHPPGRRAPPRRPGRGHHRLREGHPRPSRPGPWDHDRSGLAPRGRPRRSSPPRRAPASQPRRTAARHSRRHERTSPGGTPQGPPPADRPRTDLPPNGISGKARASVPLLVEGNPQHMRMAVLRGGLWGRRTCRRLVHLEVGVLVAQGRGLEQDAVPGGVEVTKVDRAGVGVEQPPGPGSWTRT